MTKPAIVLTGASGFIGRYFVENLVGVRVRALTRRAMVPQAEACGIEWVVGDLSDRAVWGRLLEPGCIVVNLAYAQMSATEEAVAATRAMVAACVEAKVDRLIHCSTISVFGRTTGGAIDESTPCNPIDDYGRQKLAIERALVEAVGGRFEFAILRPSAVFGIGGLALQTLCDSLNGGSRVLNYFRASLFGRRRMHLVPVETVVAALRFLCDIDRSIDGEVFIVADDEDSLNNFRDVERILVEALGASKYPLPTLSLPPVLLKLLLSLRGRSEIDPNCIYRASKLRDWGFVPPVSFAVALRDFAIGIGEAPYGKVSV